jgi:FkbM family methyltransferase
LKEKIKRTFGFILTHPLSRRHPVISILRLLLWQAQSLSAPSKFFVKKFLGPVKFYARRGLTGITGNIYTGLHEFNDMFFLLHFLRAADSFLDIGANVGSYTLLAAGFCGADSTAIEPVKTTFAILSNNIRLNSLQHKVRLINSGAGSRQGTAEFSIGEDTTNHVVTAKGTGNEPSMELPLITIDTIPNLTPALIKIDVEGYETEVLAGMTRTLRSPSLHAIIIELNGSGGRYGYDELQIHRLLSENGFCPYDYNPFERRLTPSEKISGFNTIYCRDLEFINSRIKNAPGIKLMGEII